MKIPNTPKPNKEKDIIYLWYSNNQINIAYMISNHYTPFWSSKFQENMIKLKPWFLLAILSVFLCTSLGSDAVESVLRRLDSKRAPSVVQESAAKGVLQRLLPAHLHSFEFKIVSKVLYCYVHHLFSSFGSLSFTPFCIGNWLYVVSIT